MPIDSGAYQLRPHIELAEDQCGGPQGIDDQRAVIGNVEREVRSEIDIEPRGKTFGARREMRVDKLDVGPTLPDSLEHWPRLQSFSDRRGVHPHERARGIAARSSPGHVAFDEIAPS